MKPKLINKKAIKSGNMLEVWQYENPIVTNRPPPKPAALTPNPISEEEREKQRLKNHYTSYHNFMRKAVANFGEGYAKFLTLTFDDKKVDHDIKDITASNEKFSLFMKRLKYHLGQELKYIAAVEFQDKKGRGAVHYHVILNMPFVEHEILTKIWKHGSVYIEEVKELENSRHVAAYVAKYMRKGAIDKRLTGQKKYFGSRNLEKPSKKINDDCDEWIARTADGETYEEKEYYSEHGHGLIKYGKYYLPKEKEETP